MQFRSSTIGPLAFTGFPHWCYQLSLPHFCGRHTTENREIQGPRDYFKAHLYVLSLLGGTFLLVRVERAEAAKKIILNVLMAAEVTYLIAYNAISNLTEWMRSTGKSGVASFFLQTQLPAIVMATFAFHYAHGEQGYE